MIESLVASIMIGFSITLLIKALSLVQIHGYTIEDSKHIAMAKYVYNTIDWDSPSVVGYEGYVYTPHVYQFNSNLEWHILEIKNTTTGLEIFRIEQLEIIEK